MQIRTPVIGMKKREIVVRGLGLGAPLALIRQPLTLVGKPVALVGKPVALVGDSVTLSGARDLRCARGFRRLRRRGC